MTLTLWFLAIIAVVVVLAIKYGGKSEKSANQQNQLEAVKNAKKVRDKLKSDPSFRERVRKRFTR